VRTSKLKPAKQRIVQAIQLRYTLIMYSKD
jgi:hypothetical protein